jgi:hypothetical protein
MYTKQKPTGLEISVSMLQPQTTKNSLKIGMNIMLLEATPSFLLPCNQ